MRKWLVAAAAAGLLAVSSMAALADEASGSITNVDMEGMSVTLDDGNTYLLPDSVDPTTLTTGEKVTIEYTKNDDGSMEATQVTEDK